MGSKWGRAMTVALIADTIFVGVSAAHFDGSYCDDLRKVFCTEIPGEDSPLAPVRFPSFAPITTVSSSTSDVTIASLPSSIR